ncbi:MAG: hypothetical protein AAF449_21205, partial [Myxococcota bacterium]
MNIMRRARKQTTLLATVALAAAIPLTAVAEAETPPTLERVLDDDLRKRLRGRPTDAVSDKLISASAKMYALAKDALARGEAKAALAALGEDPEKPLNFAKIKLDSLFVDRETLVLGEALSALGRHKEALEAFVIALEKAEVLDVGLQAARGLRKTLQALERPAEELRVTEALLGVRGVSRRPELLLAKARALKGIGQPEDAARQAWRLMLAYPTATASTEAEILLKQLKSEGTEIPTTNGRLELARVRNLIQDRAFSRAKAALTAFEKAYPKLALAAEMQRLELLHRQRKRTEERALLEKMHRRGLRRDNGPKVLYRLARLAMKRNDNTKAIDYFDELQKRFPRSSLARRGAYLAAWLPYNEGLFMKA